MGQHHFARAYLSGNATFDSILAVNTPGPPFIDWRMDKLLRL